MIKKKLLLITVLAILILTSFGLNNVYAAADSSSLKIYCPNVLLVERKTGKILYEKNAYDQIYMASTTKILTAILVLENCELDEKATVSYDAIMSIPPGYTHAALRENEQFTVNELLHALLIPSANDAANVLAEHVSGSVEEFAKLMNEKAKEIGCTGSNFTNPSGLHEEDHYSTTYDLYLIADYALQFDTFREIIVKTSCSMPATDIYKKDDRNFVTTNSMLRESMTDYYYEYTTGIKTGYTDYSKDCIVASAEKDGVEYIAVVMGGGYTKDKYLREKYLDCQTLFNFAFDNYTIEPIANQGNVCTQVTIGNATKETKELDIVYESNIQALIDVSTELSSIKPNIQLKDNLKAPIKKGDILGTVTYDIEGITYASNLLANSDVEKVSYLLIAFRIILIPTILVALYFILCFTKKKTRKAFSKKNYRL